MLMARAENDFNALMMNVIGHDNKLVKGYMGVVPRKIKPYRVNELAGRCEQDRTSADLCENR